MRSFSPSIFVVGVSVLFTLLALTAVATDNTWPQTRGYKDQWPEDEHAYKVLTERWAKASKNALGTEADITAIKRAVLPCIKGKNPAVSEVRWLSAKLTMAFASWCSSPIASASFFYIVEKRKDKWEILTWYQISIS